MRGAHSHMYFISSSISRFMASFSRRAARPTTPASIATHKHGIVTSVRAYALCCRRNTWLLHPSTGGNVRQTYFAVDVDVL